ncbi:VG15 protein [Nocardia sp. NPDC055002]
MTPDRYAYEQLLISQALVRFVTNVAKFFAAPYLSLNDWVRLLELIYPEVERAREESARIAREFYDAERALHHPELPRNDRFLEEYTLRWFIEDMEPVRLRASQEDAGSAGTNAVALRAVRSVENAGRRQIISAVENEPQTQIVRGWARVATGRETCGWCLMLISRGPTYMGADTAGLDLTDTEAKQMYLAGEDVSEYMNEWHDGCDCKVVPVFDVKNWPGRDERIRALKLWKEAAKEAADLIRSGKARTKDYNREAINALRRRLSRGEIDPAEYARLRAA